MLPNFLVIGAMKAGTSSLCDVLRRHPHVFVSRQKELHFFNNDERYARGRVWYESHFEYVTHEKAIGEGTPGYTKIHSSPQVVDRIADLLPEAKLIYLVRHPMKRIESQWMHQKAYDTRYPPFNVAVRERRELIEASLYWEAIDAFRRRFAEHQILVVFSEDLRKAPEAELRRTFAFLGVDPDVRVASEGGQNVMVTPELLGWLRKIPGFVKWKNVMPRGARAWFKQTVLMPFHKRPEWDEPTRQWFVERYGQQIERFLAEYGKPADFWKL